MDSKDENDRETEQIQIDKILKLQQRFDAEQKIDDSQVKQKANKKIQISILNYTDNKNQESFEQQSEENKHINGQEIEERTGNHAQSVNKQRQKSAQKKPMDLISENESVSKEKKITQFFQKSQTKVVNQNKRKNNSKSSQQDLQQINQNCSKENKKIEDVNTTNVNNNLKVDENLQKSYKKLEAQLKQVQEKLREKEYIYDYQKQQLLSADEIIQKEKEQFKEYKTKSERMLIKYLLKDEQQQRIINKERVDVLKNKYGKFVQRMINNQLVDGWEDGIEIKTQIKKLKSIKEEIEGKKKQLKIKKDQSQNNEEIEAFKEKINFNLIINQKEEQTLQHEYDRMQNEKVLFQYELKKMYEEDNCKFCKACPPYFHSAWPLLKERYQILSLIGKGGFGEVYKAFDLIGQKEVAVKIGQLNPSWNEQNCQQYVKHIEREVDTHLKLSHPNIVQLIDGGFIVDNYSMGTVLELCEGPDLYYYLKKYKTLPEFEAKVILKQIVSGMQYLHNFRQSIIHYDLKPQNILFNRGEVKITDFGLCKIMEENCSKLQLTSQGVGTYWYLPPEVFQKGKPDINTKVDIWSIGVIFYEMLFGVKPFGNDLSQEKILEQEVILKSYKVQFPAKPVISEEAKMFIERCLRHQPDLRWDINQICNSSYFSNKELKKK